jgi:hypothetical protein
MEAFPFNLKTALEKSSGITFNTNPYAFQLENGKNYVGYYGFNQNKDIFFRINLPLVRNNNFISHIDFFTNIFNRTPDFSIIPIESTISNIVTLITKGEKEPFLSEFQESSSLIIQRREQLFKFWIEENPKAKDINFLTSHTVEDIYTKVFLLTKENKEVPLAWFRTKYKEYLISLGVQLKRGRKTGGKRERIIADPARRAELLDKREGFDFEKNLLALKGYTKGIIDGNINALLVYGPPGVGKSHIVKTVINESDLIPRKDYIEYSGGVNDTKALVNILYNHGGAKDGKPKLILFDDFSIPRDKVSIDILAQAMDTNHLKSPYITYGDKKVINDWEKIRIALDNERNDWIDKYIKATGSKPSKKEIRDFENKQMDKPSIKNKVPPAFSFEGRIIIITNDVNINPKLLSRTLKILIDPTNQEILNSIKKDNFSSEIDSKTKKEVFAVLEYVSSGVKAIDYRDFILAVQIYQTLSPLGGDIWKVKIYDNILMKDTEI